MRNLPPTAQPNVDARVLITSDGSSIGAKSTNSTASPKPSCKFAAVAIAKKESHLPVIVDPSQGCGRADLVPMLCRGAVAVGADGLLIEVHPFPTEALSDGQQQVDFEVFSLLISELEPFLNATRRKLV